MSVLENIYLANFEALNLDLLLPALEAAVPGVVAKERDMAKRQKPDWASLLLQHPKPSKSASLIVCEKNSRANVADTLSRCRRSKHGAVVEKAPRYLWSQLKLDKKASDKQVTKAFDMHYEILAAVVRLATGVIEILENEKLYDAASFARHARTLRESRRNQK